MIIRIEGGDAAAVATGRGELDALAVAWGHGAEEWQDEARPAGSDADRRADPVAITALVLSIPSTALAVADLADRIRKRRRAGDLIDHARRLTDRGVTVSLITDDQRVEITTLDADRLLELASPASKPLAEDEGSR